MALQDYFVWGSGGQKKTPDQIARERKIAEAMIASGVDTSPVGHWTQGAARMANALVGNIKQGRADAAEKAGIEGATNKFNSLDLAKILSGGQAAYPSSVAAGASPTSAAATGTATTTAPLAASALPSSFLSALDKHEGGGDYNTLFGHAQRSGGEFSGVQVSQMPIKDVLAFADPSGRYAQSVKGKVGRVATPMGRHQIVGTTLRNAVREMGLDPNAAFDQSTQDAIANHLAQRRISSANTLSGKMAALRSEWEGFRNVPDAQLAQIVADLQGSGSAQPSVQVASLDPSIGVAQAYAPQPQQTANTAAGAINMIAPPEPQEITQDQFNARFNGAPVAQPVQPQAMQQPDQMPTRAIPQAPQSQFSDSAVRQHDAMFGGALAPAGAAPQQAPAGQGYFPEAPVMDSYASMAPQQGGNQLQALMAAASDPFLNDSQRGMINTALQQQMQNSDPMRQMQMQKLQRDLNTPAKRNTTSINGNLVDADTGQVIANFPEQTKPTSDIQNFEYARQNGFAGTFDQYQQMVKKAGASSTNVAVGEGDKFYEALDKKNAETFSSLSDTGVQARSKLAQIDRLRGLMAASPTGATAALKLAAGEYGIKTDGLDDLLASQALINELVPQQRQPGSGPMSDADLALFKQSLPRIINTPEGNNLILDTMTGISQYQMQMGDIADRVANREITAAQGRELIKNLKNPLEDFRKSSKDIGTGGNRTSSGVQWSIEP